MNKSKIFGSTLIVIGTTIGAGMLALPIISATAGFITATILLVAVWAMMTLTGLYVLEVNLALPNYSNSFSTMSATTLGNIGKIISWCCTLFLLYALTSAYIIGNASVLNVLIELFFHTKIPNWINALIFTLVMGTIVFWSTKAVDYCNRYLLSFKGILLITTLCMLMPQINLVNLLRESHQNFGRYLWTIIPIFICSFGFHTVIPSLRIYIGDQIKELKFIIICGSIITLTVYSVWLLVTIGMIPESGMNSFSTINNSVDKLIQTIFVIANNKWITMGINGFSNIAMTTSFLGVTLGLFDFLADGCKRSNTNSGRLQTALLTFIPPLGFAVFFPNGFIQALNYASLFATILVVVLPPLMVYKLRKHATLSSPYKVFGGQSLIILTISVGVILVGVQVLSYLRILT